jgi:hypothetical protein
MRRIVITLGICLITLLSALGWSETPTADAPVVQLVSRHAHKARKHHAHKAPKHHRAKHSRTI